MIIHRFTGFAKMLLPSCVDRPDVATVADIVANVAFRHNNYLYFWLTYLTYKHPKSLIWPPFWIYSLFLSLSSPYLFNGPIVSKTNILWVQDIKNIYNPQNVKWFEPKNADVKCRNNFALCIWCWLFCFMTAFRCRWSPGEAVIPENMLVPDMRQPQLSCIFKLK